MSQTVGFLLERYEALKQSVSFQEAARENEVNHYVVRFRELCDKLHTKERNIKVYAAELGISSRHLYEVVKKGTALTPKQMLTNYIIATSKHLLLTTTLSLQEIAILLHFGDQSNFTQYFNSMWEKPLLHFVKSIFG